MDTLAEQLNGLAEAFEKMAEETSREDKDIYSCLICRDTGWVIDENGNAVPCTCRRSDAEEKKLDIPHLRNMNFADFDLRLYPENISTKHGRSYRQLAKDALRQAVSFCESLKKGINRPGLIFEGEVGSGKTFLAAAIANELLGKGIDVDFIVVPEFLDALRQSIRDEGVNEGALIKRAKTASVLVLDDMGAHNFSPWVQNILFTIINYRLNHQLPIIITTNLDMEELEDAVGERIASRLVEVGTNVKLFIDKDIRLKLYKNGRNSW
ncbi:MAG: ATP-binding protein [Solobacterium sp.]|nr:ATP-binding protein [Solobacterium sp.]